MCEQRASLVNIHPIRCRGVENCHHKQIHTILLFSKKFNLYKMEELDVSADNSKVTLGESSLATSSAPNAKRDPINDGVYGSLSPTGATRSGKSMPDSDNSSAHQITISRPPSATGESDYGTKSKSLRASNSTAGTEFLRNRPSFPANAPNVFRDPQTLVITCAQMDQPTYSPVVEALKGMQFFVTPPKLYIRTVAYMFESKVDNTNELVPSKNRHDSIRSTSSSTYTSNDGCRKVKVFDIKTELTGYIDTDYLLYNPHAISDYFNDTRHRHKSISLYKYVASSRLKSVCTALKEQFSGDFDGFSVNITNDEFVDTMPDTYSGVFFSDGCGSVTRWGMSLLMPPIIPFILHEHFNRKEYDSGFVFRIRKLQIESIEKDLMRIVHEAMQPVFKIPADDEQDAAEIKKHLVGGLQVQTTHEAENKQSRRSFDDVLARVDQTSTV